MNFTDEEIKKLAEAIAQKLFELLKAEQDSNLRDKIRLINLPRP